MVIPRPIEGKHRSIKDRLNVLLLAIIVVIPFVRIGGEPLILLDIPARKFHIFGLTIWPQELYFLHVLMLIAGVMLFFFTALIGRIWCGYACPQTVFTEIFDWLARLVGGKKYGKPSADRAMWARVYASWIVLSLLLSVVYLSYFRPYEQVVGDLSALRIFAAGEGWVPATWFLFYAGLAVFSFVNAAYFRENACKYVCPYGRFQTALLDAHSPIVNYDTGRGEPRREHKQKVGEHKGDCIDCGLCVVSCPTGIDIREGLQVGCIACGLCVDACTQIMGKYDKPTLIDYRTIEQAKKPEARPRYVRPRTVVYGTVLVAFLCLFGYLLMTRVPVYAAALRDRAIYNIHIPTMGYRNGYVLRIGNMSNRKLRVKIEIPADQNSDAPTFQVMQPRDVYSLEPSGLEKIRLIVQFPDKARSQLPASMPIRFKISDVDNPKHVRFTESVFSFPG